MLWRRHQHGLGRAGAIQVGPAVGEGDAVVRAVDDQSVVLIAGSPELLQDQTDACRGTERPRLRDVLLCVCVRAQLHTLIQPAHGGVLSRQVGPCRRCVGHERRNLKQHES